MKILLLLTYIFSFSGCNKADDYVYLNTPPRQEKRDDVLKVRTLLRNAEIDIVWVVDNSGSMSTIQNNIIANSSLFMESFVKNNFMKWRMAVVSTDSNQPPFLGMPYNSTDPQYFDNNSLDPVPTFSQAIRNLGTNGSASEYVFYNSFRFMIDQTYNHFFRPDAHLAVIMVTDEEEQSERKYGDQFKATNLISTVSALKNPGTIIRYYGAFDFKDLQDCDSWEPYANSPFEEIIDATGGIHMSACTADFGKDLAEIGKDIISLVDAPAVLLAERPKVDTIKVFYGDEEVPGGRQTDGAFWYYNQYYNTLNFYNLDFIPADDEDAAIRVAYDVDDGIDRSEDDED